jgi:hypothetical protein
LLEFWRATHEDGTLLNDLYDPSLSTRFLGDLYQDLSQHAKETYALLQTPVFVEEFILDRTLEPALNERPLKDFKLIDPTCGSGHFLLGAFDRLLDRWNHYAPGLETQARVQAALNAIYGVDLNPFAVAIAHFRLTVAALKASGLTSLEKAPAFNSHLAVGDSLIHGPDPGVLPGMSDRAAYMPFTYATEDAPFLLSILEESTYDVVVGNPPYITVKDKALNRIYRSKYASVCKGKYALTAPFMALFFSLAKSENSAGWVGQITSNSFMKREFGSPLIEGFLTRRDLRFVVDTSGAYIPGHGTPTVIIVGRNRQPVGQTVRAVLGVRGETTRPSEPAKGQVWTAIVEHINDSEWEDSWVTVTNLDRIRLATHPWSLGGGGAVDLLAGMSLGRSRLGERSHRIGVFGIMGSDDCMMVSRGLIRRRSLEASSTRLLISGDDVRDFMVLGSQPCWFPYSPSHELLPLAEFPQWSRHFWPYRTELGNRATFSGGTYLSDGRPYYEWHQLPKDVGAHGWAIVFAGISTHNHFVLIRGGEATNRWAPIIKLPNTSAEADHLALLGILNSSSACFWLKQNSHSKGNGGINEGFRGDDWEEFYEFTGTTLRDYPLPHTLPMERGRMLDELAQVISRYTLGTSFDSRTPSVETIVEARAAWEKTYARMIAIQEELDWECYSLYGLVNEDLTYGGSDLPGLTLGERAFEIALARRTEANAGNDSWFTRHGSTPITDTPPCWPTAYRDLVRRRLDLIASDVSIRLLEQPEYKRRWPQESWEKRVEQALGEWLLDRLEDKRFWFDGQARPLPCSVAQLADEVNRDADMVSVLGLWEGRPDVPVTQSLVRLLADEAVPYLAAFRYKDSGLRKREAWEETWRLQRREDALEKVGTIAVPPKYTSADFRKQSYWQARGKLDVPKERFILYPEAGRETDPTPLLGWAGWDHAQQSLALALIIGEREKDGWSDDRLVPLVAGLAELQPWVDQWHGEVDPDYGVSMAAFCREQLTARAAQVGKTLDELAAWRPAPAARGRRARSSQ